jgi:hypothetical protein
LPNSRPASRPPTSDCGCGHADWRDTTAYVIHVAEVDDGRCAIVGGGTSPNDLQAAMTKEEICDALAIYLFNEKKAADFEGHDPLFSVNLFLKDEKDRQLAEECLRHDDQFVALAKGIYTLYARKRDEAFWRAYLRYADDIDECGVVDPTDSERALYAGITREIADNGDAARFRKAGPGRFAAN